MKKKEYKPTKKNRELLKKYITKGLFKYISISIKVCLLSNFNGFVSKSEYIFKLPLSLIALAL